MLSRVADALFWMSRYLERAEHIARLLDVSFHQGLDLYGLSAGEGNEVKDILTVLQSLPPPETQSIHYWLALEAENPSSIMSCISKARNNARSIRGNISTALWRELNKLYWQLRDPEFAARAIDSPHEFYAAVEVGNHLFQGVCDATLVHDEGWRFIQLGKYLERAEKTLRVLDVKHQHYQSGAEAGDLPMTHLRWAGVLRGCLAYEAYQRLYISRVEPERVVEFLLLHDMFPRSVRYSLEAAARSLEEVEGRPAERGETRADRILGRMISELKYADLDRLPEGGLHEYLQGLLQNCWQASAAINQQYALV